MSSTPSNASPNSTGSTGSTGSTVLNNRYRLLGTLAAGGMATVFKGQDQLLNRLVAVKVLRDRFASDPKFVQRFRDESQAAANLNHPNIVTIFDVGRDVVNGIERHYIVMELAEGQDLKQTIRTRAMNNDPFTVDEAVSIGKQICDGVAYAHRRGLAHCDLKPQNVMLTSPTGDSRVKVTDFGIARAYTASLNTGEQADVVWGTPQYFAPEQASGGAPTPASDVYSIGVMLYEMLAGRLPFESRDARQLAQMHLTQQPAPVHVANPSVTLQLEGIVMRALDKDPSQRYATADQFARALAAYNLQGEEQTMVNMQPVRVPQQPVTSPRPVAQPKPQPPPPPKPIQPKRNVITDTIPTQATRSVRESGPDPLLWLLGAVAFLCLIGLIPLYFFVYRAYSTPPTPSVLETPVIAPVINSAITSTQVLSPVAQVKVPQLAGKLVGEASQELAALGLNLSVIEERPGGVYTQPVVLEQRTAADTIVTAGVVVEVVVSKVELKNVPSDLIGRPLDDAISQTLKSLGVPVVITDANDFAPEGTILALQPPGGTRLTLSDTLTVTVSNAGRIGLNVQMPPIVIESVNLVRDTYSPGQTVQFTVRFRATAAVNRDYQIGWYLFSPDGAQPVAQGADRGPLDRGRPFSTSQWQAGTVVEDTYTLRIPEELTPGNYPLQIGLYSGSERLVVTDPGSTIAPSNLVVLRIIRVQ